MRQGGTYIAGVAAALLVFAGQAAALPQGVSVERSSERIPANSQANPSADCPSNAYVVSGGYSAPTGTQVLLSRGYPLSSTRGGSWSFGLDNLRPDRVKVSLHGVCAKRAAVGDPSYPRDSNPFAPPSTRTSAVAQCQPGEVVIGGGSSNSSGLAPGAATAGSYPADGLDLNTKSDDAWVAEVDNLSASDDVFVAADAVCADSSDVGFRIRQAKSFKNFAPGASKTVKAACPRGYSPLSGGFSTTSSYNDMFVTTNGLSGKRSWATRITNRSTTTDFRAIVYAICGR